MIKPIFNSFFRIIVGSASLSLAALYCVGVAYRNAYLRELNIYPQVLGQTFQQFLYQGFLRSVTTVLAVLAILGASAILFAFIEAIFHAIFSKCRTGANRKKSDVNEKNVEDKVDLGLAFCCAGLAVFGFVLYLSHIESLAKEEAREIAGRINVGEVDKKSLITVVGATDLRTAVYLSCGNDRCAVFELEAKKIIYVSPNQIRANGTSDSEIKSPCESASYDL